MTVGCIKATETAEGGVFAALKREHTRGPAVNLIFDSGTPAPLTAFVCLRCRLVYVPESEGDEDW
jgi:hypothetical protein